MEKIDYKKQLKHLYKASAKKPVIVNVPAMNFFMIDGQGNPNTSEEYKNAVEVLFKLSYTIKFMIKKGEIAKDYGVMPLEGLWWMDGEFDVDKKDEWKWTMMMMQPKLVTPEIVNEAIEIVKVKKNPPALPLVRFEHFEEGKVVQILHVGPFTEEGPTVERMHAFAKAEGYQLRDKHHEIYLSDIRRAAPERWKTILRQPVL